MRIPEFRKWTRLQLGQDGSCTVKVELTDNQLDQALENAKEWWNAFFGLHKEAYFSLVAHQVEYDLSAVSPAVDEVMKVYFTHSSELIDFRGLYPGFLDVNGIPYDAMGTYDQNSPLGTITQTLQQMKTARRVFSSDPDWEYYREDFDENNPVRLLRLMPPPVDTGTGVYVYRVAPSAVKLHMYKPRDLFLIREYALAEAKYMLGRIRGKYPGGLPAAGSDRQLDGESLISESREDKERLERKILDYGGPVMPCIG